MSEAYRRVSSEARCRFPPLACAAYADRALRDLVRETELWPPPFVSPMFVAAGLASATPIASMPGVSRLSIARPWRRPASPPRSGSRASSCSGSPTIRTRRDRAPGTRAAWFSWRFGRSSSAPRDDRDRRPVPLRVHRSRPLRAPGPDGTVDNDSTLELLARTAVSHARAGADIIAPSDMMDGRVAAIRAELDRRLHGSADPRLRRQFASSFYGPFREAADAAPAFGDRRGYQLDSRTGGGAARGRARRRRGRRHGDGQAGAPLPRPDPPDQGRHRPADGRLQRLGRVRDAEGCGGGRLPRRACSVLETLTGIKRAGADIIITYHAKDAARWLQ